MDNSVCLFDPAYELEALQNMSIVSLVKSQQTPLIAAQAHTFIKLYDSTKVKTVYSDMSATNSILKEKKLRVQANLGLQVNNRDWLLHA